MNAELKRIVVVFSFISMLCISCASAVDEAGLDLLTQETQAMKKSVDGKVQALLNAPSGVFDIEYDAAGSIRRLKIKGESEVSTALRGTRGDRQARDKAGRDARAAFSKFLNERITVSEAEGETFTIREKDGAESAEFENTSTRLITLNSEALLRGLTVLMDQIDGEGADRKATVILGWSKKLTDAALTAQASMARTAAPMVKERAPVSAFSTAKGSVTRLGDVDDF